MTRNSQIGRQLYLQPLYLHRHLLLHRYLHLHQYLLCLRPLPLQHHLLRLLDHRPLLSAPVRVVRLLRRGKLEEDREPNWRRRRRGRRRMKTLIYVRQIRNRPMPRCQHHCFMTCQIYHFQCTTFQPFHCRFQHHSMILGFWESASTGIMIAGTALKRTLGSGIMRATIMTGKEGMWKQIRVMSVTGDGLRTC